jgi:amino acid transporter
MQQSSNPGLVRAIRRWDLVAVAVNGIIGAGIFGLPSKVFGLTGATSLVAYFVCAVVVTLIILCFAEVGSRYTGTGGPYLYAREAFGPVIGFEVGWMMWLARLTAFAANCNLFVEYLSYFWPSAKIGSLRAIVIISVVVLLTIVNVVGVRNAAVVGDVFTIAKLIPIILFIGAGLFFIQPENFTGTVQPSFDDFSTSVLLLVYAFTGFEFASIPGGEVRDPRRDLPLAILTGIGVVTVLYLFIQVICIGTLPELAGSTKPLADAGARFLGAVGGSIISLGAMISIIGNLIGILLVAPRLTYAMADDGQLPKILSATHRRFHTPHVSILLSAALMLVLTLSGTFIQSVTISTIARLVAFTATCAALPVLRRRQDAPPALFRVAFGPVVAVAALLLTVWLLSQSAAGEARNAAIVAVFGLLVTAVYRLIRRWRRVSVEV